MGGKKAVKLGGQIWLKSGQNVDKFDNYKQEQTKTNMHHLGFYVL